MAGGTGVRIQSDGSGDLGEASGARVDELVRLMRRSPSRAEQIAAASGDPAKLDQLLAPGFAPVRASRLPGAETLRDMLMRLLRGG